MRRNCLFLALVLLLLFSFSCKKDDKDPSYTFPLQIGNYWEMRYTWNYPGDNLESVVVTDTMRMWVDAAAQSPEGEACVKIKYTYTSEPEDNYYEYVVNRADGLYLLGWEESSALPPLKNRIKRPFTGLFSRWEHKQAGKELHWVENPRMIIPHTCPEGETWSYPYDDDFASVQYTVLAKTNVQTGCGDFSCFRRKAVLMPEEPDLNWINYDYFCAKGLAKFRSDSEQAIMNEFGVLIGTFEGFSELLLLDCDLN